MKIFLIISLLLGFTFVKADDLETQIAKTANDLSSSINLQNNFITRFFDSSTKNILDQYLKKNPFSQMSESQTRELLQGVLGDKFIGKWFAKNPKTLDFLVRWLRDKEAMPSFLSILNKPNKMKLYSYFAIGLFILSFLFNLFNSKGGLFKRIFYKFCIFFGVAGLNLLAFFIIFRTEVYPTIEIGKSIFL